MRTAPSQRYTKLKRMLKDVCDAKAPNFNPDFLAPPKKQVSQVIGPENGKKEQNRRFVLFGNAVDAPSLACGLYLVSTPIGNLRDISLRALETLAGADLILCEDTRHSARLLSHFGISTPRAALHEHNERARAEAIVRQLADGAAIALISDAGTPLVSDPGFQLVRAARAAGQVPVAVPGASAALSGLVISGLPSDRFAFIGFVPNKAAARTKALADLAGLPMSLIFYESPRRLAASLSAMAQTLGADRPAMVALELTKRFERSFAGTLAELAERFDAKETVKGEVVIVVGGASQRPAEKGDWEQILAQRLTELPLRGAVDEVAAGFALPRRQVYEAALALKKQQQ